MKEHISSSSIKWGPCTFDELCRIVPVSYDMPLARSLREVALTQMAGQQLSASDIKIYIMGAAPFCFSDPNKNDPKWYTAEDRFYMRELLQDILETFKCPKDIIDYELLFHDDTYEPAQIHTLEDVLTSTLTIMRYDHLMRRRIDMKSGFEMDLQEALANRCAGIKLSGQSLLDIAVNKFKVISARRNELGSPHPFFYANLLIGNRICFAARHDFDKLCNQRITDEVNS